MKTAINIKNISKSFPGVLANDDVSFDIMNGTIHAIVGENGAGKSTLMKILYGMQKPDNGELKINGQDTKFQSPKDAISAGIGMVHQHFMLADNLTVWENIVLGIDRSNLSKIKKTEYIPEISDFAAIKTVIEGLPTSEDGNPPVISAPAFPPVPPKSILFIPPL